MGRRRGNPFLRWSFIRLMLGLPRLQKTWQVGDGREQKLAEHVLSDARKGDDADCIRSIDEFAWTKDFLINVGDEKGQILDDALRQKHPEKVLELGTYCGYSALRMAVAAPQAKIISLEFNGDNAAIAEKILAHAGVDDRVTVIVGTLGDGGTTIDKLKSEFGIGDGSFDFVFIDHDKERYLPDLELILEEGILAEGAVVVADNIKFPGAPKYLAYMDEQEGVRWRTTRHETHVEYQTLLKDVVLVSELIKVK